MVETERALSALRKKKTSKVENPEKSRKIDTNHVEIP
jgi:hypothetical protein